MGGALKLEKCSYYLISFKWKANGTWHYDQNELNLHFTLGMPMADGSLEEIEYLPISKAIKTLGSMTCPLGSSVSAIKRMKTLGQEWVDRVLASSLSCRNVWFMVDCQFWPRVGYGICNNIASWDKLEKSMQRVYWQLIARGGVQRSAPVALRQLDRGFYGIGCPHPGVECLIGQITKLLVHYGCKSGLGIELQVTMELLIMELGLSLQPLQESFATYGKLITNTWIRSVWEKASKFDITIKIAPNGSCRWLGNPGLRIQENGLSSTDSVATNKSFSSWMYWMLEESVWTRNTWTCRRTTKSGQLLFSPLKNLHAKILPCGEQWYTPSPLGGKCRIVSADSHPEVIRCGNGGSTRS